MTPSLQSPSLSLTFISAVIMSTCGAHMQQYKASFYRRNFSYALNASQATSGDRGLTLSSDNLHSGGDREEKLIGRRTSSSSRSRTSLIDSNMVAAAGMRWNVPNRRRRQSGVQTGHRDSTSRTASRHTGQSRSGDTRPQGVTFGFGDASQSDRKGFRVTSPTVPRDLDGTSRFQWGPESTSHVPMWGLDSTSHSSVWDLDSTSFVNQEPESTSHSAKWDLDDTSSGEQPSLQNTSCSGQWRQGKFNLLTSNAPLMAETTTELTTTGDSDNEAEMTSSTTGNAFDDVDISDFVMSSPRMWTFDSSVKKELKPIFKEITRRGVIGKKSYKKYSRVVRYIAFPLLLIGLVMNGIALQVFRGLPKTVTNIYMTCLISFDVAFLLFVISSTVIAGVFSAVSANVASSYVLFLYSVHRYFILSARQVIVCTTAFMCLDRFLALACPLKKVKIVVLRYPKLLILSASIVILLFNSHKLIKREIKEEEVTVAGAGNKTTVKFMGYTRLYLDNKNLIDDLTITSSCLFQYLPLVVMTVANISLVASLHKYSRRASAVEIALRRSRCQRGSRQTLDGSDCFSPSPSLSSFSSVHSVSGASLGSVGEVRDGTRRNVSSSKNSNMVKPRSVSLDSPQTLSPSAGEKSDSATSNLKNGAIKGETPRKSNVTLKSLQFFQLERHKSVTVIVYSVLFFLLALPLALLPLLQRLVPEFDIFKREHFLFLAYFRTIPLLDIISASMNFLVFFIKGGAFRVGVRRICRCCCRSRDGDGSRRAATFRVHHVTKAVLEKSHVTGSPGRKSSSGVVLQSSFKLRDGVCY